MGAERLEDQISRLDLHARLDVGGSGEVGATVRTASVRWIACIEAAAGEPSEEISHYAF